MKKFWEVNVGGRLCRVLEDETEGYEVAVFDPIRRGVTRTSLPPGTTLKEAQANALRIVATLEPNGFSNSQDRIAGHVKWFNKQKGYGFIRLPDGREVFVHFSTILMDGFKDLGDDEEVELETFLGDRGLVAVNVIRTSDDNSANYRDLLRRRYEALAVVMIDGALRVIGIAPDGRWHFVDQFDRIHGLLYAWSGESRAYREATEELESLINDKYVKEQTLHEFFERFPDFILNDEYARAHSKVALVDEDGDNALIPDFMLEPVGQSRLCDLLELKLPSVRLEVFQTRRQRFAATVIEACAQLRTYSDYFEDRANRDRFKARYGLEAFRPRLFVIIGRRGRVDPIEWRRIEGDVPALNVCTYDDILERAKTKLTKYGSLRGMI